MTKIWRYSERDIEHVTLWHSHVTLWHSHVTVSHFGFDFLQFTSLLICWKLRPVYLCHALVWRRISIEEARHLIWLWNYDHDENETLACVTIYLVVGSIVIQTSNEAERETKREDEDNHGWDDETKNTGQPAENISYKLIKLSAFWTELTWQYPRYSKLVRRILNVIKLIKTDNKILKDTCILYYIGRPLTPLTLASDTTIY